MAGRKRRSGRIRRQPERSQHFIRSAAKARDLVELANIQPGDLVVEAGAGDGALTEPLARAADQVIAIEKDAVLCRSLNERFTGVSNVTIRRADFLRYGLPSGSYRFVANIPFHRTADIVRKITLGDRPAEAAHVIMAAQAATRFLGQPHGPESSLSLRIKARYELSIVAWLGPEQFAPRPSVNSVMLAMFQRPENPVSRINPAAFDRLARTVFDVESINARLLHRLTGRPISSSLVNDLGFPIGSSPSKISFEHWKNVLQLSKWNRAL